MNSELLAIADELTLMGEDEWATIIKRHANLAALEKQAAIEWAEAIFDAQACSAKEWTDDWMRLFMTDNNADGRIDKWNRACAILEANGMLERHPTNAEWVRIRESEDG